MRIQTDIESHLSKVEPEVEVLLAEVVGGRLVRLFIDHPRGVTLDLCERVSNHLAMVRETYALEVSSPGTERPLSKPEHFRRYVGRRARVRTRGPRGTADEAGGPEGGSSSGATGKVGGPWRRSFTGELLGANDNAVTVAADNGVVSIPYADITRSNLVGD